MPIAIARAVEVIVGCALIIFALRLFLRYKTPLRRPTAVIIVWLLGVVMASRTIEMLCRKSAFSTAYIAAQIALSVGLFLIACFGTYWQMRQVARTSVLKNDSDSGEGGWPRSD
jgi:prolipoprotein diacylglyceryltransferase